MADMQLLPLTAAISTAPIVGVRCVYQSVNEQSARSRLQFPSSGNRNGCLLCHGVEPITTAMRYKTQLTPGDNSLNSHS